MEEFKAYILFDGTNYFLYFSLPDGSGILEGAAISLRIFPPGSDHAQATATLVNRLVSVITDTILTGGDVGRISISESEYNVIDTIDEHTEIDGSNVRKFLLAEQIDLYNSATITEVEEIETIQTVVGFEQDFNFQRLDLFDDKGIVIKKSIQDVRDITKVKTDISYQFEVPNSKVNNRALQHLLRSDVNSLDPRGFHESLIEVNNNSQLRGVSTITETEVKSGRENKTKLQFYGSLLKLPQTLGEYHLRDLQLGQYLAPVSDLGLLELFTAHPEFNSAQANLEEVSEAIANHVRIPLMSYNQRYFFDTGTDLYTDVMDSDDEVIDPSGIVEETTRIANGLGTEIEDSNLANIAHTSTTLARALDGVKLPEVKRSLRCDAILEAIESKFAEEGIRFSRGLDITGRPTDVVDDIVTDQFFNTDPWKRLFMLMHTKATQVTLGGKVVFDEPWPDRDGEHVGAATIDNRTFTTLHPYYSNDHNYRNYYLNMVTQYSGDETYIINLRQSGNDAILWTSGERTGSFSTPTTPTGLDGEVTEGNFEDDTTVNGERLFLTNGYKEVYFEIVSADGESVIEDITITPTFWEEETDRAILLLRRFRRYLFNGQTNTSSSFSSSNESQIPKIKIQDFIIGIWKQFNLTAFYDIDINGNEIINVDTLDNYYRRGGEHDLTQYVDNQDVTVKASQFYSDIEFKYESPNTFLAKEFENIFNYNYGDDNINLRENDDGQVINPRLPKKTYSIKLPFEQIVMEQISNPQTSQGDVGHDTDVVYGWVADDGGAAVDIKPWLHYLEYNSVGGAADVTILTRNSDGTANTGVKDYVGATKYLRYANGNVQTTLTYKPELDERTTALSPNTLYKNYYEGTILESFSRRAHIHTFKGRLPASFITNFSLADKIRIGSDYYRINEIDIRLKDGKSTLELVSLPVDFRVIDSFGLGDEEVIAAAPNVDTFVAINIGTQTADLRGFSFDNSADLTTRGFYYLEGAGHTAPTIINTGTLVSVPIDNSNVFEQRVSGLTANTTYGYVAFATNAVGIGNGDVREFKTLADVGDRVLPSGITGSSKDITATQATLVGNVGDNGGDTLSEYGFRWGTTNDQATLISSGNLESITNTFTGEFEITLSQLDHSTTYYFIVFAANSVGTAYSEVFSFTTSAITPPVHEGGVFPHGSSVLDTSFSLEGAIRSGGADPTDYGFYYRTGSGYSEAQMLSGGTQVQSSSFLQYNNGIFNFSVHNISATQNTTYSVMAYATNVGGTSYSQINTFTTEETIVTGPPVVGALSINFEGTLSIRAIGRILEDYDLPVTEVGFYYGAGSIDTVNELTVQGTKITTTLGSNDQWSSTVTNLNHGTTYNWIAFATNSEGTDYSSIQSLTTMEDAAVPDMSTLPASNITQTSARFGGQVISSIGSSVTAAGWYYGSQTSVSSLVANGTRVNYSGSAPTSTFYQVVSGLDPDTTYRYVAFGTNNEGTGYGTVRSFTTDLPDPDPPTVSTLSLTTIQETSVVFRGSLSSDGGATVTNRGFVYIEKSDIAGTPTGAQIAADSDSDIVQSSSFSSTSFQLISGTLVEGTDYWYAAFATNSAGTSYGGVMDFTTLDSIDPPTVDDVTVSDIRETAATVRSDVSNNGGSSLQETGFYYYANTGSPSVATVVANGTKRQAGVAATIIGPVDITSLDEDTKYHVVAYARNTEHTGYSSNTETFTTESASASGATSASAVPSVATLSPGTFAADAISIAITANGPWDLLVDYGSSNSSSSVNVNPTSGETGTSNISVTAFSSALAGVVNIYVVPSGSTDMSDSLENIRVTIAPQGGST